MMTALGQKIRIRHCVMDGGITPYQLPWIVTRFIALKDYLMMMIGRAGGVGPVSYTHLIVYSRKKTRCLPAVKSFILAGLWQEESKDIKRQQNCIKCVQSVVSAWDRQAHS